jgi:hypothetical protein
MLVRFDRHVPSVINLRLHKLCNYATFLHVNATGNSLREKFNQYRHLQTTAKLRNAVASINGCRMVRSIAGVAFKIKSPMSKKFNIRLWRRTKHTIGTIHEENNNIRLVLLIQDASQQVYASELVITHTRLKIT